MECWFNAISCISVVDSAAVEGEERIESGVKSKSGPVQLVWTNACSAETAIASRASSASAVGSGSAAAAR